MSNPDPIVSVTPQIFTLPLDEVLEDAMHGNHSHFELVTVTIRTKDGLEGTGYTYTGGRGGQAIKAMLDHDLVPWLMGRDSVEVEEVQDAIYWHMHYVGRGGIAAFVISAIDIALWDIRCKRLGKPLVEVAGGASASTAAYFGGIDLNFLLPKLLASIEGYLAKGANGVKIKIGQKDPKDDHARIKAVRDLIGKDCAFMVDANYALDIDQAIAMGQAIADHDITWFEEPIDPDDFSGYGEVAEQITIPLAMGENLHTMAEFVLAMNESQLGFIQPDASNCGGITGWLSVATMAEAVGIPVCSHGMQELHVSLMASQAHAGWMEIHSFPIDRYTTRPLVIENHRAMAPSEPGTGVVFDWDHLKRASESV